MIVLNTATMSGLYTWVYSHDPAFDRDSPEFDERELEAAIESCDPVRLRALCKPGEEPTYFRLKHITGECKRWLVGYMIDHSKADAPISPLALRKAAAHALCGVENLRGPDGTTINVSQTSIDPESKHRVAPGDFLDMLERVDSGNLVNALGVAVVRSLSPSPN